MNGEITSNTEEIQAFEDGNGDDTQLRNNAAGPPPNSLELSMAKIRAKAKSQDKKRNLDPRKFNKVKSKVGKNMKVLDKAASTAYLS